jgi:DNA-binding GntR family transcriptional regulator
MARPTDPGRELIAEAPLAAAHPERLADHAHRVIREAIVEGKLAMGQRLVETALSERLGMSRAPIREAMRRLAEEGLVVESANRGSFVAVIGPTDLVDLYHFRVAVEEMAARLFVRHEGKVSTLRQPLSKMQAAAEAGDVAAVVRQEIAFHREILRQSQNPYLRSAFERLSGPIQMALSIDDAAYSDLKAVADEHLEVMAALAGDDESAAAATMRQHILASLEQAARHIGSG